MIQLEELPKFVAREMDEVVERPGQRRRNIANYNDGLSTEQWVVAVEDGEDVQELADRTRQEGTAGDEQVDQREQDTR